MSLNNFHANAVGITNILEILNIMKYLLKFTHRYFVNRQRKAQKIK